MSAHAIPLEQRRQVLVARVSLQRFALSSDIGSLRASVRPRRWQRPLALAALGVAASGYRWLPAAVRCWSLLRRR
jgi:hypothetical protein